LVEQTQRELVELLNHEQGSLSVAQRCSGIEGSTPLFSSLLNYLHGNPYSNTERPAITSGIQLLAVQGTTNYPILASVYDQGEDFVLQMETDRRINPHRMLGYLSVATRSLVNALEQSPGTTALALSVLPENERCQVIELFNGSYIPNPHSALIHELFEEQVKRTPDSAALAYDGQSLTYIELNGRANQIARYLTAKGVGPDQLVGLYFERSLDMVVGMLGILKAGGAYLALDTAHPRDRLTYIVRDALPRVVLTQEHLRSRLPELAVGIVALDSQWSEIARHDTSNLAPTSTAALPHQLAYTIYTSGSTGQPKGVLVEHENVVNHWRAMERLYREPFDCRRIALNASIAFDASIQQLVQLLSGCTVFIVPQAARLDASLLFEFLEQHKIEGIDCTPSQLNVWIAAGLLENRERTLRTVLVGGEAIDPVLWERLARCDNVLFHNVYGPTECTVDSTAAPLRELSTAPHIGRTLQNTRIYVLDGHHRVVPIGVTGEIYISGMGVARGYLNRPDLTAERFLPDPFNSDPQLRMYKTGDLGQWRSDGTIGYLGRNDHQVKIRGVRIELGEIESRLCLHEKVAEAVVIARENARGERRLIAYLIPKGMEVPSIEALRRHLEEALPEQMVPNAFVILESFPLTSSGKVNRLALPTSELETNVTQQYEAPQGSVEERLGEIWQTVLQIKRIGREHNFFTVGGHSLLAVKLLSKLNQDFGAHLQLADIYKCPTIREQATRIVGTSTTEELVDLTREAALDDTIVALPGMREDPQNTVLLTGATGFVGRFLLEQLLKDTDATIYCLIRARSPQSATQRLKETLLTWNLWRQEFDQRLVAVTGDLSSPCLGLDRNTYEILCQRIDTIYHCATSMNHLETYPMSRPTNVESARELLKIATKYKPKLLNYVSTLGVFSSTAHSADRVVNEETSIDHERHSTSHGYAASKWVGERIFLTATERGIPCNIFRLGLVWADAQCGRYDELQREYRIFKSCLLSGYGIANYRYEMDPTPVDYVARAVVSLTERYRNGHGVFHISSSSQRIDGIFERCNEVAGTALKIVSRYEWTCRVRELHRRGQTLPVLPLIDYVLPPPPGPSREARCSLQLPRTHIDCTRTRRELEHIGIMSPALDDHLLRLHLKDILARDAELRRWSETNRLNIPGIRYG
jgi:amino acid adenylation domain-containing protein/thioester reductase-like protein